MSDNNKAPVDFFIKMHEALAAKNYQTALNYCNTILSYEHGNVTMKTFHELLSKKLEIMDEETDSNSTLDSSSSESDNESNK